MSSNTPEVHVISHPLVQHKLTLMRQKDRSTSSFRRLLGEIGMLMAYEVTRDMPTQLIEIETPLATMRSPVIEGRKTVFVAILRAGTGFLDGMLEVIPGARVGHVGLYRVEPCPRLGIGIEERLPVGVGERFPGDGAADGGDMGGRQPPYDAGHPTLPAS